MTHFRSLLSAFFVAVGILVCVESRSQVSDVTKIGGMGTGSIGIARTGQFTELTTNNNFYHPISDLRGTFAGIWTETAGKKFAAALQTNSAKVLPAIQKIQMTPRAGIVDLVFTDPNMPVSVRVRAFSPIIPYDLKNSNLPTMLYVITVKNDLRAPVSVATTFSFENTVGVGGNFAKGEFSDRTGNTVKTLAPKNGLFGMEMKRPARQINDPTTRLEYNANGDYTLLAAPPTPDSVVTTASWNSLENNGELWEKFKSMGEISGECGAGMESKVHPAAAIAMKCQLNAGQSVTFPIAIGWYTPRQFVLGGTEYGHHYEKNFDNSREVAEYAIENWQNLLATSTEWQNILEQSTVPIAIRNQVFDAVNKLTSRSVLTRDNGDKQETGPAIPTTVGSGGVLGTNQADLDILSTFFPSLFSRTLSLYVESQNTDGSFPGNIGQIDTNIGKPEQSATIKPADPLTSEALIVAISDYYFQTGELKFLNTFFPAVKHYVDHILSQTQNPSESRNFQSNSTEKVTRLAEAIGDKTLINRLKSGASQQTSNPLMESPLTKINDYSGFSFDAIHGVLKMTPTFTGSEKVVRCPVFSPRYWGYITATRSISTLKLGFRIDRFAPGQSYSGIMKKSASEIPAPSPKAPKGIGSEIQIRKIIIPAFSANVSIVSVSIGRAPVPGKFTVQGKTIVFDCENEVQMTTGQHIDITVR